MRKNLFPATAALLAWTFNPVTADNATAQDTRVTRAPSVWSYSFGGSNRAVIGVTLSNTTRSDTLGDDRSFRVDRR